MFKKKSKKDEEIEEEVIEDDEDDEDEPKPKRNPRLILLILVVMLLCCVGGLGMYLLAPKPPAQPPVDTPAEQPGDTPAEQPGDTPAEQPGDTPAEQPGDTPAEQPGESGDTDLTPPETSGSCDNNTPPVAQGVGPEQAMMGKGQAMAIFEATASNDPDGTIESYEWSLGDGNTMTGENVTYGYNTTGSFAVTLTVTDNCGATSQDSLNITVVGPTPPATEE